MNHIIAITRKDLRLILADRSGFFTSLAVPIILAGVFGMAFSGLGGESKPFTVAIIDEDDSPTSRDFAKRLDDLEAVVVTHPPLAQAREEVKRGKIVAAITLPKGFGERLTSGLFGGDRPNLLMALDPSRRMEGGILTGLLIRDAFECIGGRLMDPTEGIAQVQRGIDALVADSMPEERKAPLRDLLLSSKKALEDYQARRKAGSDAGGGDGGFSLTEPFTVTQESLAPEAAENPSSYAIEFPAVAAMFVLFGAMNGALAFVREKNAGTMRRLLQGPVTRGEIVLGKSGAVVVMGVIQATVMFLAAALIFGVRPNGSIVGLAVMIVLTAIAAAALAMFLAAAGESEGMVHGIALLVILIMSALGGSMFPLVFMPEWMQQVAGVTLNKWAIDGFNSVVWRGLPLTAILPNAAVLLGYSAVLFLLGRRLFRWKI